MSNYQMAPAPSFKQIMPRNKRIGELQRLKAEFESIRNYNDRTISMRMRQVRLWRLFRKIQEINVNASKNPKSTRMPQKTYEQLRGERLSHARELGVEFSRENGLNLVRQSPRTARKFGLNFDERTENEDRSSLIKRRINYGNVMSYENLRRFKSDKLGQSSSKANTQLKSDSSIEIDRVEKLRNRTRYDLKSDSKLSNYKVSKADGEQLNNDDNVERGPINAIEEVESTGGYPKYNLVKSYTFLFEESSINPSDNISLNSEEQDEQIAVILNGLRNSVPQLRNISMKQLIKTQNGRVEYIRAASGNDQLEEQAQNISCDSVSESSCDSPNTLRKISNDRNLPTSQFEHSVLIAESMEDLRFADDEVLIKSEKYGDDVNRTEIADNDGMMDKYHDDLKNKTEKDLPSSNCAMDDASAHSTVHPSLKNKPGTALDLRMSPHVTEFVKRFEPFPKRDNKSDERVKESFESGVDKLRSIFEHQAQ